MRRAVPVVMVAILVVTLFPATAQACEKATRTLVQSAAQSRAVIEYRSIATNPAPWGRTAYAATRIWGTGLVERWMLSGRNLDSCPDTWPRPRGTMVYVFPGAGTAEVYAEQPVSGLEAAALEARFGAPRTFEVSRVDRVLSWALVAPSWIVGGIGLIGLFIWWWIRRKRTDRRYLF